MNWIIILVIGVLLIAVVPLILLVLLLKRLPEKTFRELEEKYPGQVIVYRDGANYFGQKSKGMGKVRGNGILILTEKKLVFRMALPERWYEVDVDRITDIEHPRSFMGKGTISPMLVVHFTNENGESDEIGWAVRDQEKWAEEIRKIRDRKW